jgi:hypothetical protein
MDAPERLAEAVEWARSALGADEREAVADTLVETAAPLDVHAAEAGRAIGAILDELESMGCDRTDWARMVAGDLTEPDVVKPPTEMSEDELRREMARRRKYGVGEDE